MRLAQQQDTDLLLVEALPAVLGDTRLGTILAEAPCDVGILVGRPTEGPVLVAFSGAEHDWAAIELGAWLAMARGTKLVLAGSTGDGSGRDASRLLASASLAIQRTVGVAAEPLLVSPDPSALTAATAGMGLVVVGLSHRRQQEGLGPARAALVEREDGATLLVRRGLRPGGSPPPVTRPASPGRSSRSRPDSARPGRRRGASALVRARRGREIRGNSPPSVSSTAGIRSTGSNDAGPGFVPVRRTSVAGTTAWRLPSRRTGPVGVSSRSEASAVRSRPRSVPGSPSTLSSAWSSASTAV